MAVNFDNWTIWGFVAQGLFFGSFVYQWWISEKSKKSLITEGFWWIRVVASIMLFIYAYRRRDLVIMTGLVLQLALYGRNIKIIKNGEKKKNQR